MEIKQLEAFSAVVRHRSFSRAAESLYLSQSSVSAHIAALEKSLGTQLLIRTTKDLSLTAAGRRFHIQALNILALRDQAVQTARGETPAQPGEIQILSSTVPAQHLLPEMIAAFRRDHPNTVFHVDQADSRRVLREMTSFRYDFGFVGTAGQSPRLVHYPIYDDRLVLVLPREQATHLDIIHEDITSFLYTHPFVMREQGSGTRAETEELLRGMGVDPHRLEVAAYFFDTHSILEAVSNGLGVSVVSSVSAALHVLNERVAAVEIDSPLSVRQIHLLYNRELLLSPLQRAFAGHVRSFYCR